MKVQYKHNSVRRYIASLKLTFDGKFHGHPVSVVVDRKHVIVEIWWDAVIYRHRKACLAKK
jgi:hypothetical protein